MTVETPRMLQTLECYTFFRFFSKTRGVSTIQSHFVTTLILVRAHCVKKTVFLLHLILSQFGKRLVLFCTQKFSIFLQKSRNKNAPAEPDDGSQLYEGQQYFKT